MKLSQDDVRPIYIQLVHWLEGEIMNGNLSEDERIYSQYSLAEMFEINPATGAKALLILLEEGIIYKKRGLGMFVEKGAKDMLMKKRRGEQFEKLVATLVEEAKRLGITEVELIDCIKKQLGNQN